MGYGSVLLRLGGVRSQSPNRLQKYYIRDRDNARPVRLAINKPSRIRNKVMGVIILTPSIRYRSIYRSLKATQN